MPHHDYIWVKSFLQAFLFSGLCSVCPLEYEKLYFKKSRCFTQEKYSRFSRHIYTENLSSYSCDVKNHKENFAIHVILVHFVFADILSNLHTLVSPFFENLTQREAFKHFQFIHLLTVSMDFSTSGKGI